MKGEDRGDVPAVRVIITERAFNRALIAFAAGMTLMYLLAFTCGIVLGRVGERNSAANDTALTGEASGGDGDDILLRVGELEIWRGSAEARIRSLATHWLVTREGDSR